MFSIGTGTFFVRGPLVSNLSMTTRIRFPDSFSTASRWRTTASRPHPIPRRVSVQEDREWRVPQETSASTMARASSAGVEEASPAAVARGRHGPPARKDRKPKSTRHLFRIIGRRCYDTRPLFWPPPPLAPARSRGAQPGEIRTGSLPRDAETLLLMENAGNAGKLRPEVFRRLSSAGQRAVLRAAGLLSPPAARAVRAP